MTVCHISYWKSCLSSLSAIFYSSSCLHSRFILLAFTLSPLYLSVRVTIIFVTAFPLFILQQNKVLSQEEASCYGCLQLTMFLKYKLTISHRPQSQASLHHFSFFGIALETTSSALLSHQKAPRVYLYNKHTHTHCYSFLEFSFEFCRVFYTPCVMLQIRPHDRRSWVCKERFPVSLFFPLFF